MFIHAPLSRRVQARKVGRGSQPLGYIDVLDKLHAIVDRDRVYERGSLDNTSIVGVKDQKMGPISVPMIDSTDGKMLNSFVDTHVGKGLLYRGAQCLQEQREPRRVWFTVLGNTSDIKERAGQYQRGGDILVDAEEAGSPKGVPQAEPEAPSLLRR